MSNSSGWLQNLSLCFTKSCILLSLVLAPALSAASGTLVAADNSARRTAVVDGTIFSIPREIAAAKNDNTATGFQSLILLIPPTLLHVDFAPIRNRNKEVIAVYLQTEQNNSAHIESYNGIIKSQTPKHLGTYEIYEIDPLTSLYVDTLGHVPQFITCDNEWGGIFAGMPQVCSITEPFVAKYGDGSHSARPLILTYGCTFQDIVNIRKINDAILNILTSFVVGTTK